MESTQIITTKIDATKSRFNVKCFATGLLSSFGHNPTFAIRSFAGEIQFDPGDPTTARLSVQIPADKIELTDDVSAKDRKEILESMNGDVLDTSRFPQITYESTSVTANKIYDNQYRVTVAGNLTLHGTTAPLTIESNVSVNGDRIRANGDFSILQTDFDIRPFSAAGGSIKLKDELKFTFDIVANA